MTYVIAMIVLLGFCVFVHELGHLLGGKLVGIKARVFSIGFGKGIIKKEWNGTTYQIAPFPLGGYCSFYGENVTDEREGKSYEFLTAAPWRRIVTVAAGPFFNLVFGVILFFVMNLVGYSTETNRVLISEEYTASGEISPAEKGGMKNGDEVVSINGKTIDSFSALQSNVALSGGKPLDVKVMRNKTAIDLVVTPEKSSGGYYLLGVAPYGTRILVRGVDKDEPAGKAGLVEMDIISALDGTPTTDTKAFNDYIKSHIGKAVQLTVNRQGKTMVIPVVPRQREKLSLKISDGKGGKTELVTFKTAMIENAIKKGTVKINGTVIKSIDDFSAVIQRNEQKESILENAGGTYRGMIAFDKHGFLGIVRDTAPDMVEIHHGFASGLKKALVDPVDFIAMNLKGIGMLISGKLNLRENLSGPVRIAQIAGDTVKYRGISQFIVLMAKISIILMVMNLLPLPAVDGSFLVFFTLEWIRGRALNQKVMEKIQIFGFIFLILLSVFVVFNDLTFMPFFGKIMALFK
jgi:regulator of sigma E protease